MIALEVPAFDFLAELVRYPAKNFPDLLEKETGRLQSECASLLPVFSEFSDGTRNRSLPELEELYTQTFDINPASALEVGWHLFGENYERGSFLIKMREYLRRFNLSESGELPDHLSLVLKVAGRLESEEAAGFVHAYLLPALQKMNADFKDEKNPYKALLQTLLKLFQSRFTLSCSGSEK